MTAKDGREAGMMNMDSPLCLCLQAVLKRLVLLGNRNAVVKMRVQGGSLAPVVLPGA
jgi:hypothetical protein